MAPLARADGAVSAVVTGVILSERPCGARSPRSETRRPMPGAAAERRSGLAAVLDELEGVRDVVAHCETEVGRGGDDAPNADRR